MDKDNVKEFPADKIVKPKMENLVMVHIAGLPTIIGQKFGRVIKRPYYFTIEGQAGNQVSFKFGIMPFVDGEIFLEGNYMWHSVTTPELHDKYKRLISPIIQV